MTRQDSPRERAVSLISTSVDDLRSSLYFYKWDIKVDVETIRLALNMCVERRWKTKAAMLQRKLKQMEENIKTMEVVDG